MCFHFHVLFVTMSSAVKLNRSVNSVEGDPVVENRKVINLPQRASRLQRRSQRLQLRQLPTFSSQFFHPLGRVNPGLHAGFQLSAALIIMCKTVRMDENESSN